MTFRWTGRGSAAGSLVAYLCITNLDPLNGLLFERFLNRIEFLCDIDIDCCYERRGEIVNTSSKNILRTTLPR
jgi:DNA polymerase III alpha subunit